jgi:replication factor C small subunit
VGKTTAARAFGREVLGADWENSFSQLDAGDDRSLKFIRSRLGPAVGLPPMRGAPFRIIFFDEADELTAEAQGALRPLMEAASGTCVFILACNNLEPISKAIQSRCTLLEFSPVPTEELKQVIRDALTKTSFTLTETQIDSIASRADGIPREAIKLLLEESESSPG